MSKRVLVLMKQDADGRKLKRMLRAEPNGDGAMRIISRTSPAYPERDFRCPRCEGVLWVRETHERFGCQSCTQQVTVAGGDGDISFLMPTPHARL